VSDLLLIRHAETQPIQGRDSRDWPLTEAGRRAARQLAGTLQNAGLARIVVSQEEKARATGLELSRTLRRPLEVAPGLHEHERRGVPFLEPDAWQALMARFFAEPHALVFGQETADAARRRFERALLSVLGHYPSGRLAVVSHATVMALVIAHHNGLSAHEVWRGLAMPDLRWLTRDFRLSPASSA
jgi:broad specificity phosphatase PhoE